MVRRVLVAIVALLLAVQVVRSAAAAALSPLHPATAAKFWAAHPSVEIALGMTEIGRSARERRDIGESTFAMIDDAATKSPLAPEPFLVRGVQARTAGDVELAKRAFVAAQWRDPRSMPAAYFLADYYFRADDAVHGLIQTALLARLSPQGTDAVAPFVAAYAHDRANWPQMRALFRTQEGVEDGVLTALARDPRNADAILALADAEHRKPDSAWLRQLLSNLVANADYDRAHAIWSSVGRGREGGGLLYDAGFSAPEAPPPFNWSLSTSDVGLAERESGNRLHLIFYGNQDGVLASQLLLLPAGTYRLQMQVAGAPVHAESIRWSITCDKASEPFASAGLVEAASRGWTFQVPASCRAQWLQLSGQSGDVAQQSDVTIAALSLTRGGAGA
jgi:SnoaL-like domain